MAYQPKDKKMILNHVFAEMPDTMIEFLQRNKMLSTYCSAKPTIEDYERLKRQGYTIHQILNT